MCGIAGMILSRPDEGRQAQLRQMLQVTSHRGPDSSGIGQPHPLALLGHNRLSIIDLSEAASQPMYAFDKSCCIIFNGEVYNFTELKEQLKDEYPFSTHSDTEVLIALYRKHGVAMLDKLIGMFALAIWDVQQEALFIARDRFGVKPFYYTIDAEGNFIFCSEIKGFKRAGISLTPNEKVWAGYLANATYGSITETFWNEVSQLPGGHYAIVKPGAPLQVQQWYHFTKAIANTRKYDDVEALIQDHTALLLDAVSLRFRADVPVGFNLSGGLDSSLLLGLIHHLYPDNANIKAYSFYSDDERYDELPWVRHLLEGKSYPLNPVLLDKDELPRTFADVSAAQDEPYGGMPTIAYAQIFRKARANGSIVLLDGQGMDESWAGYDYYLDDNDRSLVQGMSDDAPVRPNCIAADLLATAEKIGFDKPFDDELRNKQYRDIFHTKIPRALRFNDRVSMMSSTELREPFLDHRAVEMAFAQDASIKIRDGVQKWVLRRIAAQFIPANIGLAPKRPVQTPQREWLRGPCAFMVDEAIEKAYSHPVLKHWFRFDEIQKEWDRFKEGGSSNSFYVWQWLNTAALF